MFSHITTMVNGWCLVIAYWLDCESHKSPTCDRVTLPILCRSLQTEERSGCVGHEPCNNGHKSINPRPASTSSG